jgi:hypothetical protein
MMALLYLLWLIMFALNKVSALVHGANLDDRLMIINLKLSTKWLLMLGQLLCKLSQASSTIYQFCMILSVTLFLVLDR